MQRSFLLLLVVLATLVASSCSGTSSDDTSITVYSGRSEELIAPLIEQFEADTGVTVDVRYGDSAELAATIIEEDDNSPADVFLAQDPASLGAVAINDLFAPLEPNLLANVPAEFSDSAGRWVGISGRARVVAYDSSKLSPADMPATEEGFTDESWQGKLAIAPTNGSFLAFVAAKILLDGEDATRSWLEGIEQNKSPTYPKNSVIVAAVDDGEVEAGLVNHYYLFRRQAEVGDTSAANHFLSGGGAGSLVMPSGAGLLASSTSAAAQSFIAFLLSAEAQEYFADETFEYPLAVGTEANASLPAISDLNPPVLDLSELATVLDRATDLVAAAGLL